MIDEQHAAIVIIERAARALVRGPMRMLDARGVISVTERQAYILRRNVDAITRKSYPSNEEGS